MYDQKIIIYSLEQENFHKKNGNSEIFPENISIIYKDVNANPSSFIFEAIENPQSDFMFFTGNHQLLNFALVELGLAKMQEYPISFVYSDGYLVNKYKQPLLLPTYKPNLLKTNKLILNIPILVRGGITLKPSVETISKINNLALFLLLQELTENIVGYHLSEPTYNMFNFTSNIQSELKVLGV